MHRHCTATARIEPVTFVTSGWATNQKIFLNGTATRTCTWKCVYTLVPLRYLTGTNTFASLGVPLLISMKNQIKDAATSTPQRKYVYTYIYQNFAVADVIAATFVRFACVHWYMLAYHRSFACAWINAFLSGSSWSASVKFPFVYIVCTFMKMQSYKK